MLLNEGRIGVLELAYLSSFWGHYTTLSYHIPTSLDATTLDLPISSIAFWSLKKYTCD